MVTLLTTSSDGVTDSSWMPSSDTSDLPQTSVSLSWKFLGTPSGSDTLSSVTLGDTNGVQALVLSEDFIDIDLLFEKTSGEVDFGSDVSAVDLEFDDVSLLLSEWQVLHLSVGQESDDLAVLLDLFQRLFDRSLVVVPLGLVLAESLLFAVSPVAVEPSAGFVRNVGGPDGFQGSETSWGFDVSDDTDTDHWWGFDDCDWLDDVFLVHFASLSVDVSDNVGHTSFEADESSEVASFGLVIFWVRFDSS